MPEQYAIKDIRPPQILEAINKVKNKYSDQLDGELELATSMRSIHRVTGKIMAMEHIFNELHSELSKIIQS